MYLACMTAAFNQLSFFWFSTVGIMVLLLLPWRFNQGVRASLFAPQVLVRKDLSSLVLSVSNIDKVSQKGYLSPSLVLFHLVPNVLIFSPTVFL